jgi:hypothetical protein
MASPAKFDTAAPLVETRSEADVSNGRKRSEEGTVIDHPYLGSVYLVQKGGPSRCSVCVPVHETAKMANADAVKTTDLTEWLGRRELWRIRIRTPLCPMNRALVRVMV